MRQPLEAVSGQADEGGFCLVEAFQLAVTNGEERLPRHQLRRFCGDLGNNVDDLFETALIPADHGELRSVPHKRVSLAGVLPEAQRFARNGLGFLESPC